MQDNNITQIRVTPDRKWVYRTPLVISGLLLVTVLVSLVMAFGPKPQVLYWEFWGSLYPARYGQAMRGTSGIVLLTLPLITHIFLHGSIMHLVLNMLFLLAFGTPVAVRMAFNRATGQPDGKSAGAVVFILFYLVSGIAGGILFTLLHLSDPVSAVGASGAISALMAAAIRIATPAPGGGSVNIHGPILPILNSKIIRFTAVIVILNLAVGLFGNKMMPGGDKIAWEAHIGGYFFGLLLFPTFDALAQGLHRRSSATNKMVR